MPDCKHSVIQVDMVADKGIYATCNDCHSYLFSPDWTTPFQVAKQEDDNATANN